MAVKEILDNHMKLVYNSLDEFEKNLKPDQLFTKIDTKKYLKDNHECWFKNDAISNLTNFCHKKWVEDYDKKHEEEDKKQKDPAEIPENVSKEKFIWYILEKEKIDYDEMDTNFIMSLIKIAYPNFIKEISDHCLRTEIVNWQQYKITDAKIDYAVQKTLSEIESSE